MFLDTAIDNTVNSWSAFFLPSQRIFVLYLLSAFVIAILSYIWFSAREERARPDGIKKGMLRYIFDPDIWLHKSARQDYVFFMVNALIYYGVISQLLIGGHVYYTGFSAGLEALFGPRDGPVFEASLLSFAVYTLVIALAVDLAVYVTHYLQHRVASLWQFHMVHHSAEVLTPVSVYRMHPVDLLFTGLVGGALIAMSLAGFVYLTKSQPTELMVMNVNLVIFVFYLTGYNLRHSHIWISYPRWLSYILISPAQHQTHHSVNEKHFDKNFGLIFAFWDWIFGTLYVPKGYEKLEFGVSKETPNPFLSVQDIYLKPFVEAWRILFPQDGPNRKRAAMLFGIMALTSGYLMVSAAGKSQAGAQAVALPSLHLEDLTWTEVAAAQANGFDTIIIPTGGTEQNGPHVILGKHNYIVKAASAQIAAELGGALVAPVLSYVPEGDIAPEKTVHMRWPGTLTVSEHLFEAIIESAARSYHAHGFAKIVFVGDSFGNQTAQTIVAQRLSEEWASENILVGSLSDYYDANGQTEYLLASGYTQDQIGGHAGIRDTSELMWVAPHGVRSVVTPAPPGWGTGASGDASEASAELGRKMVALKVEAAVGQFRAMVARHRATASTH